MQQFNLQQANVAVIGAGTMGIGIAQLAAMNGHQTLVFDLDLIHDVLAIVVGESQRDFLSVAGEGDLLHGPDTHL